MNERLHAAADLATIQDHQDRTRRRARLPWWVYLGMFLLVVGASAANDFVSVNGAKLIALLVLVAFVAVLVVTVATGTAPLAVVRGVRPRQSFAPRVFVLIAVLGAIGGWLVAQYGDGLTHHLGAYPNTALGPIYGIAFTGLFALGQRLSSTR